jgi:signal transduction histidine kinase/DNA-binding response OmpR family regulator
MSVFREWSIKGRLAVLTMGTTALALLLASSALFTYNQYILERTTVQYVEMLANVIGQESSSALLSGDSKSATAVLQGLSSKPHIMYARLFQQNGALLATYSHSGIDSQILPKSPLPEGSTWKKDQLELTRRIKLNEKAIGTVSILFYAEAAHSSLINFLKIIALFMLISLVGAFLLTLKLQRIIAAPILNLAATAKLITTEKNYSIRARREDGGEFGVLTDGFNEMLQQIEIRDEQLRHDSEEMEKEVAARTADLVALNAEVTASKERAEYASRAKTEFLANMSHELRTPLNAIIGYSELLEEEMLDRGKEEAIPDLKKINAAGQHLLRLINDILDLSKIEAGKTQLFLESFDIRSMVEEVLNTIQPSFTERKNTLSIHCAADLGFMHGDVVKVRQILFNLLSNACKFTKEGNVWLETTRRKSATGDEILFWIRDTGIGMTPDQLSRLFRPFNQADASTTRRFGGTGLGLAISYRFCRIMGGDITVESKLGEGSAFTLRLPAVAKAQDAEEDQPPTPDFSTQISQANRDKTILVIDDDIIARDLMTRFLTRQGFGVVASGRCREVLSLARQWHPIAITLDVLLGELSGWDILAELKADPELAGIPVIMISIVDDKDRGFALGANDYLTKPVHPERLAAILERFRGEGAPGTVLIVEDDAPSRQLMCRILNRDGWETVEAENAREGLEKIALQQPSLILLDLIMPEMNGFEFITRLRMEDRYRSIPIVVLTAMALNEKEKAHLNQHVAKIAYKTTTSWTSLMAELTSIVKKAESKNMQPKYNKEGAEASVVNQ